MPPSPWIGSTRMAQVSSSTRRAAAAGAPNAGRGEPGSLVAARLDDARRAVAEQVAAPGGEEVEVAVALGVPYVRPLAAHQADGEARVVADDVSAEEIDGLLGGHFVSC